MALHGAAYVVFVAGVAYRPVWPRCIGLGCVDAGVLPLLPAAASLAPSSGCGAVGTSQARRGRGGRTGGQPSLPDAHDGLAAHAISFLPCLRKVAVSLEDAELRVLLPPGAIAEARRWSAGDVAVVLAASRNGAALDAACRAGQAWRPALQNAHAERNDFQHCAPMLIVMTARSPTSGSSSSGRGMNSFLQQGAAVRSAPARNP